MFCFVTNVLKDLNSFDVFLFSVTMPPKFQAGQTEAKVQVPAIAANSKVGFKEVMASVIEGNV